MTSSIRFVCFCFILLLHQGSFCQSPEKGIRTLDERRLRSASLDSLLSQTMDSLGIPAISIAIINDGQTVYERTIGILDRESRQPVTATTVFEAASLSKPVFAYFVMKMADAGVIHLDTPLYRYLPHPAIKDNDVRYKLITARIVLSHSSGFPNWAHDKPIELKFTPGTGFSYSGEAYQYLAAVIAVRNKTNWKSGLDSVFQQHVAIPLNLSRTTFMEGSSRVQCCKARGHKGGTVTEQGSPGKAFGAGYSLHTNAGDYAKFLSALLKRDGLSEVAWREIFSMQNEFHEGEELLASGQTGWSIGFSIKPTQFGTRYMHTGNNQDFQSYCALYPGKQYGLVFLTNCDKAFEVYQVIGKFLSDEF